jgi:hypothetical protein
MKIFLINDKNHTHSNKSITIYYKIKFILLGIFILLLPFYDIPKTILSGLSIDFFYAFLLIPFCVKGLYYTLKNNLIYIFLFLLFSIYQSFITILNIDTVGVKGVNHLVFYLISFFLYYFFLYAVYYECGEIFVKKLLRLSVCIVIAIGLFELSLFFTDGWDAYANFLNHEQHVGIFYGLPRMRSTFNEPSHLALFMAGIAPIVLEISSKFFKVFFFAALTLTFSSSMAFGVLMALVISFLFMFFIKKRIGKNTLLILLLLIILLFVVPEGLWSKIYNINTQDTDRYNAVIESISYLKHNFFAIFFGSGATAYYQYTEMGLFNWYLQILIETGIIGLLLFFIFLMYTFNFSKTTFIHYFWFLAVIFQFIGMNHYYIPGLWMLLAWVNYKFK